MPAKKKTARKSDKHDHEAHEATSNNGSVLSFYDEDLSDVDTSFQLLREDSYVCEFASYAEEPSKDGKWLFGHFTFKVMGDDIRDVDGKKINKGYVLHKRVGLTLSENRDRDAIRKDMARIVRDGFGKRSASELRPGDQVLIRTRNNREQVKGDRTFPAETVPASFKPVK